MGALLCLLSAWLFFAPADKPLYETVALSRGDVVRTVRAYGVVKPLVAVQVGSEVSGQVAAVRVGLNAQVREGDELARIHSVDLEAALVSARAAIEGAAAALQQRETEVVRAQRTLETRHRALLRQRELMAQGFVSPSGLDDVELAEATARDELQVAAAQRRVAQADLQQARLKLSQTEQALSRTRIRAPIDGVVIARLVEPGQTLVAALQTPQLFEVAADLTRMQLEIRVDESDMAHLQQGQAVHFNVDALPDQEFQGRVTQIQRQGRKADGVTSFVVQASFDNPGQRVLPGMTASVRIETGLRREVLRVPVAALLFTPGQTAPSRLPRVSIVSREVAEKLERGMDTGADAMVRAGHRVWRPLGGDSGAAQGLLEPVDLELGLSGDEFVELRGDRLAIGERVVTGLRH